MKDRVIANRSMTYGTRRLNAGDEFTVPRRDADLLVRIGRARYASALPDSKIEREPFGGKGDHDGDGKTGGSKAADEDLTALRREYQEKLGKRAFAGWDAAELRKRMAEAKV